MAPEEMISANLRRGFVHFGEHMIERYFFGISDENFAEGRLTLPHKRL